MNLRWLQTPSPFAEVASFHQAIKTRGKDLAQFKRDLVNGAEPDKRRARGL